jgi:hypothetical protein
LKNQDALKTLIGRPVEIFGSVTVGIVNLLELSEFLVDHLEYQGYEEGEVLEQLVDG